MLPTVFAIGPFALKTMMLFMLLAVLTAGFIFWKKGKEEHYDEYELMDCFLRSMFVGLVVGRIGYVVHSIQTLGFSPLAWIDIFSHPGIHLLSAVIGGAFTLYRCARQRKWDEYEVLDFWSIGVATGLSIMYLGLFFDGTAYGAETQLPMGVLFPGLFVKHHPLQLYLMGIFIIISIFLSRVEYRYRTYEWYRAGKKAAQTGFLISFFVILSALALLITSFFALRNDPVPYLSQLEYVLLLIFGIVVLMRRRAGTH